MEDLKAPVGIKQQGQVMMFLGGLRTNVHTHLVAIHELEKALSPILSDAKDDERAVEKSIAPNCEMSNALLEIMQSIEEASRLARDILSRLQL